MPSLTVEFRIKDIVHPTPAQVLLELYGDRRLEGNLIAVTDDGEENNGLFVIRVPGLTEPVIVPAPKACAHASLLEPPDSNGSGEEVLVSNHGVYLKANSPHPE
jgi:hypothetical protein